MDEGHVHVEVTDASDPDLVGRSWTTTADGEHVQDSAEAAPGSSDETGGVAEEVDVPDVSGPHGASATPTREEIRSLVRGRIEAGEITLEDVVIDMYASQYAIELYLRDFQGRFEAFASSGLGRLLTRRAMKEVDRHGHQNG